MASRGRTAPGQTRKIRQHTEEIEVLGLRQTAYESGGSVAAHTADTTTHGISAFGATLVDDTSAAAANTTLGLGTTDAVTHASLTATGKVEMFTGQAGGWKDIIGQAVSPTAGVTIPVWTQIGATAFSAYAYNVNDLQWFMYHIPHGYTPGTDLYLHVHWLPSGTSTNLVRWELTWSFAKGYNQGAASTFNFSGAGAGQGTEIVEQAGPGVQYQHMISEIATPISDADFEVDGILMVRVRRLTRSTGAENADTIFVMMSDVHYQSNTFNTKGRTATGAGGFYA